MLSSFLYTFNLISLRHIWEDKTKSLITILSISIGVALVIAVGIINQSIYHSFSQTVEYASGRAALQIAANNSGIPESLLEEISSVPGIEYAIPLIIKTAYFESSSENKIPLVIYGVDMVQENAVRKYTMVDKSGKNINDPLSFLNQPNSILLTESFAKKHGFKEGQAITLNTAVGKKDFIVRGLMAVDGPAKAYGGNLALLDVFAAQNAFATGRGYNQIDILIKDGFTISKVRNNLKYLLGDKFQIHTPANKTEEVERMVSSFQFLLFALSFLAAIVAVILIYNSVSISVMQRRWEMGVLRSLGIPRLILPCQFFVEGIFLGLIAVPLGLTLGYALSFLLIGIVTQSMSLMYLQRISVDALYLPSWIFISGICVGIVVPVVAAMLPAFWTLKIPPLTAIKRTNYETVVIESRRSKFNLFAIGLVILGIFSTALLTFLKLQIFVGIANVLIVFGFTILAPSLVLLFSKIFRPVIGIIFPGIGPLAVDNISRSPRRTAVTVIVLMIGLSFMIMLSSLLFSFKATLQTWLEQTLKADLLVTSVQSPALLQQQEISAKFSDELKTLPEIDRVYVWRYIHLGYEGHQVMLAPSDNKVLLFVEGNEQKARAAMKTSDGAVVSENFALNLNKKIGDHLVFNTPSGTHQFPIVGIVRDYTSDQGSVLMDRSVYIKYWKDNLVNTFEIYLKKGIGFDAGREAITRKFGRRYNLVVLTTKEYRLEMMNMLDQAFLFTYALEFVVLLIALLGIFNTLIISTIERRREFGIMRSLGMSKKQLVRMIMTESSLIGFIGILMAVFVGSMLSYLWVKYYFTYLLGWILQYAFPIRSLLMALIAAFFVSLMAGYLPAKKAKKIRILDTLEYE